MSVPDAIMVALTRALVGLNTSDGVGMPLGYQPYADRVEDQDQDREERGGGKAILICYLP